ncbi:hypothetical protein [Saccharothrix sp. NRRL B-16314]|uniref:hypothetical protein n=1 Tax=Saccharothrix sp. NRRL B-16314 TaxID=1463825 RepID=UPI0022AF34F3|nr:hypothetical protein [Saccharothrix sp. NRRL B-16314]
MSTFGPPGLLDVVVVVVDVLVVVDVDVDVEVVVLMFPVQIVPFSLNCVGARPPPRLRTGPPPRSPPMLR